MPNANTLPLPFHNNAPLPFYNPFILMNHLPHVPAGSAAKGYLVSSVRRQTATNINTILPVSFNVC